MAPLAILQPVFATMLENAVRICDATFGNIYRWDGELSNLVASHNTPPALVEARTRLRIHFVPKDLVGQAIANKKAVHIADLAEHQDYIERSSPGAVAAVELGGVRTHVVVPMLKDDELIGTFHLSRQEVRPFTDKQIELVTELCCAGRNRYREHATFERTARENRRGGEAKPATWNSASPTK